LLTIIEQSPLNSDGQQHEQSSLNSDGQQFHQYQKHEQSQLLTNTV
jgi:hypothetical protein